MDKGTLAIIDGMVLKAADITVNKAAALMREFNLDDLKARGEWTCIGFKSVSHRIHSVDTRLDDSDARFDGIDERLNHVENALNILLRAA